MKHQEGEGEVKLKKRKAGIIAGHPSNDFMPGQKRVDQIVRCQVMRGGVAPCGHGAGKKKRRRKVTQQKAVYQSKDGQVNQGSFETLGKHGLCLILQETITFV